MEDWGYAPGIAQGWRATDDHHDNFGSVRQQVEAVRGKGSWSGPYGWAYLDMMMTGGQGCANQCVGPTSEAGHCNWTVPAHCPGMNDAEYRTEASLYVVVSSPMVIGTDLRLMTPIMQELLLNEEAIAINQDIEATPGDAVLACGPPPPAVCSIDLEAQASKTACVTGDSFGCTNGSWSMWASGGCRGRFACNGRGGVPCGAAGYGYAICDCYQHDAADEVWLRKLSNGSFAVAMTNWEDRPAVMTVCLGSLGWPHGNSAAARDVWAKTDIGIVEGSFTATIAAHDTLLLLLAPP